MKKTLLALAAMTAFVGAAQAQSSVTVFGVVDLNVRHQDNDGSDGTITSLSNGGNATSRLGFRGVEDLGGGLKGAFWLEGEVRADDGNASGWNWQRRSTLSLIGGFGEVRLGRDYTPTYWNHSAFDPFGDVGVGAQTNLITPLTVGSGSTRWDDPFNSGAKTLKRASNMVSYFLPAMGGVYGQLSAAAGEGTTGNKYYGGRIGYAGGPFDVAVAYGVTKETGTMTDDLTGGNIGASWDFGMAKLMLQYHQYEYDDADLKNAMIGAAVPFGAMTFKISYGLSRVDYGAGDDDAQQLALGLVYDLSKRTAIYATASMIDNDSPLRFVTSTSGSSVTGGGNDSKGYEIGVRHSF